MPVRARSSDKPERETERVSAARLRPGDVVPAGALGGGCTDRTVERVGYTDDHRVALVYWREQSGYLPCDPRTSFDRIRNAS